MIVFVGLVFSEQEEKALISSSKTGIQSAANNYQWGIIRGLFKNTKEKMIVLNSIPMGSYPKYSTVFRAKRYRYSIKEADVVNMGYVNIPGIKQFQRRRRLLHEIERIMEANNKKEKITFIVYSMYPPFLSALSKLKKRYDNFNYILIVPDLYGEYGIDGRKTFKLKCSEAISGCPDKLHKDADAYVLLTEEMKIPLNIKEKPYTVIEGLYDSETSDGEICKKRNKAIILYTGQCDNGSGLDILIEAFKKLPGGAVQLYLAGNGDKAYLSRLSKENPDIKYLGYLSKAEVIKLQKSASILVNPRSSNSEHTKYSFPSKTMEYLASGVPVVMNRLPGIPQEYYEHIIATDECSPESLAKALNSVLLLDEETIMQQTKSAREFILTKKNSTEQTKKIVDLISMLK